MRRPKDLAALKPQRMFLKYVLKRFLEQPTQWLRNGANTSEAGDFVEDVIVAYKEIKAFKTAELISKAWSLSPANAYSPDVEIRRNFIKKADETLIGGWEDLDEAFFSEEGEDIVTLIVDCIKNNPKEFGN